MTGPRFAGGLGPGQHRCPSGTGEGALRPGPQFGQRQGRPGRRGPGPVHRRGQAGPGQARLHPGEQDPGDQPDAHPVLGQVPGQGAIGVPADQHPQDRAAGTDAAAAGPGRVRRPWPPPRADRRRAWPRRVDAGARRRVVCLPRHLPGRRAKQRAARRCRCRPVRHDCPIHQGGTAHGPGGGPAGRRRCVPGRAVGNCDPNPAGLRSGVGWVRHGGERAGLRTGPAGTWTYAHRKALRIFAVALAALVFVFWGEPHRRGRHRHRHPAAGSSRPDRTDRAAPGPPETAS